MLHNKSQLARSCGVPAFRRSTAGNDVVATIFIRIFFPPLVFFPFFFLRRDLFSQKECSDQKTYLAKVDGNAQKPRGRHLSRPPLPFWGPLAAILDFAGGAALQAVSERPLRRQAGINFLFSSTTTHPPHSIRPFFPDPTNNYFLMHF